MTEAAVYRENALKIRRLTAGVTGDAATAALLLAAEYEARADDLDDGPAVQTYLTVAERVGALLNERCQQVAEFQDRERDLDTRLRQTRTDRALLEARIAGILEASSLLDVPSPARANATAN